MEDRDAPITPQCRKWVTVVLWVVVGLGLLALLGDAFELAWHW